MTSYFEKLTSINASSLSLLQQATAGVNKSGPLHQSSSSDLSSALDKIEELKQQNTKLELDLKCEHDEKADLVSLKVGLENEVLNLREVNERLEFQVEQLRVEKDKIHNVLAKVREDNAGLFIAGQGNMKKFPSLDDLSYSPCTSPTPPPSNRATSTTPGSGGALEKIAEEDETLLESLVMSSSAAAAASQTHSKNYQSELQILQSRIAQLESENARLSSFVCSRCKRQVGRNVQGGAGALIFEHDDEGLVLSAVDEDDDGFGEDDSNKQQPNNNVLASPRSPAPMLMQQQQQPTSTSSADGVEQEVHTILEMQRKIIEKLESELNAVAKEQDWKEGFRREVERMKRELEIKMGGIVRRNVVIHQEHEQNGGDGGSLEMEEI